MSLKDWISLCISSVNFAFVVLVYLQGRRAATRAEVATRNAQIDKRLAELDKEVALARQGLCAVPGTSDLSQIHARIDEVHGELKHVCGLVSGMTRTVDNINLYLMEHGK